MREYLKVFGSLLSTAIIFPSAILLLAASLIGFAFKESTELTITSVLSILVSLITFMCPALTVSNFVNPRNKISKTASVLVITGGIISFLAVIVVLSDMSKKDLNLIVTLNLIASILMTFSGYLQFQDSK